MSRFTQVTRLTATDGNVDALVAKFAEAGDIQRDNRACELMITGRSTTEPDVVYLIEVWSSKAEWEAARSSERVTEWAQGMPALVAAPPDSVCLGDVVGVGLSSGPGSTRGS